MLVELTMSKLATKESTTIPHFLQPSTVMEFIFPDGRVIVLNIKLLHLEAKAVS
jgi:hypothetical protein